MAIKLKAVAQNKGYMDEEKNNDKQETQNTNDGMDELRQEKGESKDCSHDSAAEDVEEKDEQRKLVYELAELQDKYLRLYSDFENYRRRTAREKMEMIDTASMQMIIDILPVMDDFERAVISFKDVAEINSIREGIGLILNKFKKVLEDKGLREIEAIGQLFDPDLHDAVTKIPAPSKKMKGKVVDQVQKGYLLKEKVIRHTKVIVGE